MTDNIDLSAVSLGWADIVSRLVVQRALAEKKVADLQDELDRLRHELHEAQTKLVEARQAEKDAW